ncbi:MAG: HPF/RaiA family ribosome-associated protein [Gemmatimonadaceae bacterium]|nr:HPF/RaiA family ribosome-associated protein [Gemmatimonadaceae bacterium]NUQ94400.1 HPF/RaiA family ribosome-associated protein [Gemmatimonadaceae bacterium]NUR19876.1 HPF/RaiA family ribosome-associated protein [Gemmatimonadaceae bacterium]
MEIVFQSHNAELSDRLRQRAERLVRRLAPRMGRVVDATLRFEGDGKQRRVELEFHAAGGRRLVAEGTGRYFGPALAQAGSRLKAQLDSARRTRRERMRDAVGQPLARAS